MTNTEIVILVILFIIGAYLSFKYEASIITATFGGCLFASVIGTFLIAIINLIL
jgi:hypothetical protein